QGSPSGSQTTITVDDSASSGSATYAISSSTVQVNGLTALTYRGAQGLNVKGGSGGDVYNVASTASGTPVTIPPSGTDTVNPGTPTSNRAWLAGAVTVKGNGRTRLSIDDRGNFSPPPGAFGYTPILTNFHVLDGTLTRELVSLAYNGFPQSFATTVNYSG